MLKGSQNLRQRLLLSDLTSTPTLIEDIHADATWPGLLRHEFSLIRLVETTSDDCHVVMSKSMNLSNSKSMKPPCCLQALFGAPEKTHFSITFRGPNYHNYLMPHWMMKTCWHLYLRRSLCGLSNHMRWKLMILEKRKVSVIKDCIKQISQWPLRLLENFSVIKNFQNFTPGTPEHMPGSTSSAESHHNGNKFHLLSSSICCYLFIRSG
ncbi:hypothetical protein LXL04_009747 [Taraxacum kok-saghyz]